MAIPTPAPQPLSTSMTQVLGVVSLAISVYAAWRALPIDAELKHIQKDAEKLNQRVKEFDLIQKDIESRRKITFDLYEQVHKVVEKKNVDAREEEAVKALVESLADDPYRWKLLRVLALGAQDPNVKQTSMAVSSYYEEESSHPTPSEVKPLTAEAAKVVPVPTPSAKLNVDFFYCEGTREHTQRLAEKAKAVQSASDEGRWRTRILPDSINLQEGYRLNRNIIRYNAPGETQAAQQLQSRLQKAVPGLQLDLQAIAYKTPNYISVFLCG